MLSYTVEKGSVCQGLVRVYSIQSTQFYTLLRELCYHETDCNVVAPFRSKWFHYIAKGGCYCDRQTVIYCNNHNVAPL